MRSGGAAGWAEESKSARETGGGTTDGPSSARQVRAARDENVGDEETTLLSCLCSIFPVETLFIIKFLFIPKTKAFYAIVVLFWLYGCKAFA